MNTIILDELINHYKADIKRLYGEKHDELFKWRALKTFQEEWFSNKYPDFISRFTAATKDFSIFIDNSRMHPRNGVAKLYEKEPAEVEHLFCDVLFADDNGDLNQRQINMDSFLTGMEALREKYYPANWSYKQDRHAASTYLAMYDPKSNYVYKYSEAETMAVYGEYGFDIGAGESFNLERYYNMCDELVERLRTHETLLDTHFEMLSEDCYKDLSLHLLAFDVMYCCRTYGYYKGMAHISKKDAIKQAKEDEKQKAAANLLQQELDALTSEIEELELTLPDISDIDLLNVEVTSKKDGKGTVIEHNFNTIKVQFGDVVKKYILDAKYLMRPSFENDVEVVAAYTEYNAISSKIDLLRKKIEALMVHA